MKGEKDTTVLAIHLLPNKLIAYNMMATGIVTIEIPALMVNG